MVNEIPLKLETIVNGRVWKLYGLDFKTADGTFGTYIYALSDEHAQMICMELKETAKITGQIVGVSGMES